jgi:hypothetical protein
MHAHIRLSPKNMYVYNAHIDIYIYIYTHIYIRIYTPSCVHAVIRTRSYTYTVGARACACRDVCAHARERERVGGAAAHNGPRRIKNPTERVPPAVARRAGKKGGAYIGQRGDARRVPRADVRVERRRRAERLRAEPPAVHAGGKALTCVGADCVRAPSQTRSTRARVRGGLASAIRSSV